MEPMISGLLLVVGILLGLYLAKRIKTAPVIQPPPASQTYVLVRKIDGAFWVSIEYRDREPALPPQHGKSIDDFAEACTHAEEMSIKLRKTHGNVQVQYDLKPEILPDAKGTPVARQDVCAILATNEGDEEWALYRDGEDKKKGTIEFHLAQPHEEASIGTGKGSWLFRKNKGEWKSVCLYCTSPGSGVDWTLPICNLCI